MVVKQVGSGLGPCRILSYVTVPLSVPRVPYSSWEGRCEDRGINVRSVLAQGLACDAQSVFGAIITQFSLPVATESRSETRLGCSESSASKSRTQSGIFVRASWN